MPRRLSDSEILDRIELPLDAADGALGPRDALDPEVVASVAAMRSDCRILRSLATPVLPYDFVSELADRLQPPAPRVPGAGRRSRHLLLGAWSGRLALAAGLGLAVLATAWLVFGIQGNRPTAGSDLGGQPGANHLARSAKDGTPGGLGAGSAADALASSGSGWENNALSEHALSDNDLHHPLPSVPDEGGVPTIGTTTRIADATSKEVGGGSVALIVTGSDLESALAALRGAVDGIAPSRAALVRNFSLAEAVALDSKWRRALPKGTERPLAIASGEDPSVDGTAKSSLRRSIDPAAGLAPGLAPGPALSPVEPGGENGVLAGDIALGEHLAGDRRVATAPELQFELAERGFGHSITLPADEVRRLLVALAVDGRVRVQLGRADAVAASTTGSAESPIDGWRRWQDAAAALSALEAAASAHGRVTLPVLIEIPRTGR